MPHYKAEVVVAHFNDNLSWVSHKDIRPEPNAGRGCYKGSVCLRNGAAQMHKDMCHGQLGRWLNRKYANRDRVGGLCLWLGGCSSHPAG